MNYIDTHFHLELFKEESLLADEIESNKIYTIAVSNAPRVFEHLQKICNGKKFLKAALGYHPEVIPIVGNELSLFENHLKQTKYIGEVGLDYSNSSKEEKYEQTRIFERILELCDESGDKILTVHSRRSESDIIDMIGEKFRGKVIMHYYSGNIVILKKAIEYGYYFSVNYSMTQTANGKKIISQIPQNRILTESDGPFVLIDRKKSTPFNIKDTISQLANLFNISTEQTRTLIYDNFKTLLMNYPAASGRGIIEE